MNIASAQAAQHVWVPLTDKRRVRSLLFWHASEIPSPWALLYDQGVMASDDPAKQCGAYGFSCPRT